ncbi:hypothetical protein AVEN_88816-1 [Araneus ventricosus]|uniref:Uncharacterized protein n=1 Tax=Araneus ventricosus TaxID=182803 RepID=A0A4Y2PW55_ARAVE|nr:hypothetical protein AVEN_88816-1 [Araneus ventricosus]
MDASRFNAESSSSGKSRGIALVLEFGFSCTRSSTVSSMPGVRTHCSRLITALRKELLSDNCWCSCPKSLWLGVRLIGYSCAYMRFAARPLHSPVPYTEIISVSFMCGGLWKCTASGGFKLPFLTRM